MTSEEVAKALAVPTISPKIAFKILNVSPSSGYAAIKRGEITTIKIGGKILVVAAPLRRLLMVED